MQTDKEFEDFFRERLNGLEETPPFNAWDKIKEDIKPPRTYYREMAALLLLCLVSAFIFLGIKTQPGQTGKPEIAMAPKQENTSQGQPTATKISPEIAATNFETTNRTNPADAENESFSEPQNAASSQPSKEIVAGNSTVIALNKNKPVTTNLQVTLVEKDKIRKVKTGKALSENKLN